MIENLIANFKFKSKIFYLLLLVISVIFLYAIYSTYQMKKQNFLLHADLVLVNAARATGLYLGDDFFDRVKNSSSIDNTENIENTKRLTELAKTIEDVHHIYAMVEKKGKIYFIASSRLDYSKNNAVINYFDYYSDAPELLKHRYAGSSPQFIESKNRWGNYRSVIIFMKTPAGTPYILGADIHTSSLNHELEAFLIESFLAYIFVISLMFFLFILHYRFSKLELNTIQQSQDNLNKQIEIATNELQKTNEELILANNKLKDQDELKEKVLHAAQLGFWDWYPETKKLYVSSQWKKMIGLTAADLIEDESDWSDRLHPDDLIPTLFQIQNAIEAKMPYTVQFRMRHKNGNYVWIEGSGSVVEWDNDGNVTRQSGTHKNISNQKDRELEFEIQHIQLVSLFDMNPNMTIVTNGRKIIKANHAFFNMFKDYSSIEAFLQEHECICNFFIFVDKPNYLHPSKGDWVIGASKYKDKQALLEINGKTYNFDVIAREISFTDHMEYVVTFNDTTERYNLQLQLQEISITDELTNLYNRRYFNESIASLHATMSRMRGRLGFIMIDIDNFKKYNDNYGHHQGDVALAEVARLIKQAFTRKSDIICRLGGEEFGVIVTDMSQAEVMLQAQVVCDFVYNANIPHEYNVDIGRISISVGTAYVDFTFTFKSSEQLYTEADMALYDSKTNGRNRVSAYNL